MSETKSILKSIDVLEAISVGHRTLTAIQRALDMPKTTVHRTLKSLETKTIFATSLVLAMSLAPVSFD
ncbi:helix-turn-helix domain-containing protein [Pasteurellaceae bacterium 20609_3]|uniref:helix-turn-helix domain-containing protein n=1 Tax=Spirabiliibacterium mucosae TaxID=28156 RepID=UPI001AAD68ED|nr:helix-turn-helix domain-containing protein [Spirabiliibacterium mucosae]MBE2898500.1 helix-turn-helix domain-containing protein [Spirabiliibacterium mucosae]